MIENYRGFRLKFKGQTYSLPSRVQITDLISKNKVILELSGDDMDRSGILYLKQRGIDIKGSIYIEDQTILFTDNFDIPLKEPK